MQKPRGAHRGAERNTSGLLEGVSGTFVKPGGSGVHRSSRILRKRVEVDDCLSTRAGYELSAPLTRAACDSLAESETLFRWIVHEHRTVRYLILRIGIVNGVVVQGERSSRLSFRAVQRMRMAMIAVA